MAQRLREQTILGEDPSLVPSPPTMGSLQLPVTLVPKDLMATGTCTRVSKLIQAYTLNVFQEDLF